MHSRIRKEAHNLPGKLKLCNEKNDYNIAGLPSQREWQFLEMQIWTVKNDKSRNQANGYFTCLLNGMKLKLWNTLLLTIRYQKFVSTELKNPQNVFRQGHNTTHLLLKLTLHYSRSRLRHCLTTPRINVYFKSVLPKSALMFIDNFLLSLLVFPNTI